MHVCEDYLLSNDRAKYAEMATAGACFHEPPASGQVCAYLGHFTVGSADLLSQSITANTICRSQSPSKVYAHQYITTVHCMQGVQGVSLLKHSRGRMINESD